MDLDDKLCYCFHVSKRKVVNFVKQTKPRRASQVSQCFGAGTGCGWCIPFLIKIHAKVMRGEAVEGDDIAPEEYAAMRSQYHKDVAAGAVQQNTYEAAMQNAVPASEPGVASSEPAFDYTRYFSRSRPDPEPDDLRAPEPKKGPRK